ncbi:hypothetical protein GNI_111500 [Gregarina niphandrodes]|uniref:Uncharacterized protein n=1 Tax=Gregarina niphandrodes TaxID=110365 RepID=A0A023B3J6_GRENI|nr:hypothetical protein GNI_111500 [Gregarina niphandrodes]EZG55540.1 hypothetical protein GNI_111500 [Gregarina niphandrodes]|eukprot:XP_011131526.1 hypothetical protein GNI_111500 [Gregarina niphandrodes]
MVARFTMPFGVNDGKNDDVWVDMAKSFAWLDDDIENGKWSVTKLLRDGFRILEELPDVEVGSVIFPITRELSREEMQQLKTTYDTNNTLRAYVLRSVTQCICAALATRYEFYPTGVFEPFYKRMRCWLTEFGLDLEYSKQVLGEQQAKRIGELHFFPSVLARVGASGPVHSFTAVAHHPCRSRFHHRNLTAVKKQIDERPRGQVPIIKLRTWDSENKKLQQEFPFENQSVYNKWAAKELTDEERAALIAARPPSVHSSTEDLHLEDIF